MNFGGQNINLYGPYAGQCNILNEANMPIETGYHNSNSYYNYTPPNYPYNMYQPSNVYPVRQQNQSAIRKTPLEVIDPESHTVLDFKQINKNSTEKHKSTNLLEESQVDFKREVITNESKESFTNQDIASPKKTESLLPSNNDKKSNCLVVTDLLNNETKSKSLLSTDLLGNEKNSKSLLSIDNEKKSLVVTDLQSNDKNSSTSAVTDLSKKSNITDKSKTKARISYQRSNLIELGDSLCEHGKARCDKLEKLKFIEILCLKPQLRETIEMLKRRTVVELSRSSNSYLPPRLRMNEACEADDNLNKFRRSFRAVLNKIAPQNFKQCTHEILELANTTNDSEIVEINDMVSCLIEEIFEKAVKQESYSVTYAKLCVAFKEHEDSGKVNKWNFKTSLLERCKQMFDTPLQDQLDRVREFFQNKGNEQTDEKLKKLYLDDIEEQIKKEKDKYFGNIRFIGELYIQNLLNPNIIYNCVRTLIPKCETDEAASKSVCKLLATVGKTFNAHYSDKMTELVMLLKEVYDKLDAKKTNTRVRFEIKDILEMSERNWTLRAVQKEKLVQPKTLHQLELEKQKEEKEKQIQMQQFKQNSTNSSSQNLRNYGNSNFMMKPSSSANELRAKSIHQQNQNQYKKIEVSNLFQKVQASDSGDDLVLKPRKFDWGKGSGVKPTTSANSNNHKNGTETTEWTVSKSKGSKLNKGKSLLTNSTRASAPLPNNETKSAKSKFSTLATTGKYGMFYDMEGSDECNSTSEDGSSVGITINVTSKQDTASINEESLTEEVSEEDMRDTLSDTGVINKNYWLLLPSHASFICSCLDKMMDMDKSSRDHIGRGFAFLINEGVMDQQIFIDGLKEFEGSIDDLITDIPKLWSLLSEFFGYLLKHSDLSLDQFSTIFHSSFTNSHYTFKTLVTCLLETVKFSEKRVTFDWVLTTATINNCSSENEELAKQIITKVDVSHLVKQSGEESPVQNEKDSLDVNFQQDDELKQDIKDLLRSKNEEDLYYFLEVKYSQEQMQTEQFVKFIFLCLLEFICETPGLNVVEFLDSKLLFCKRQIDNKPHFEKQVLSVICETAPQLLEKQDLLETVISYIFRQCILSEEAYHQLIQSNLSDESSDPQFDHSHKGTQKTIEIIQSLLSDSNSCLDTSNI